MEDKCQQIIYFCFFMFQADQDINSNTDANNGKIANGNGTVHNNNGYLKKDKSA